MTDGDENVVGKKESNAHVFQNKQTLQDLKHVVKYSKVKDEFPVC